MLPFSIRWKASSSSEHLRCDSWVRDNTDASFDVVRSLLYRTKPSSNTSNKGNLLLLARSKKDYNLFFSFDEGVAANYHYEYLAYFLSQSGAIAGGFRDCALRNEKLQNMPEKKDKLCLISGIVIKFVWMLTTVPNSFQSFKMCLVQIPLTSWNFYSGEKRILDITGTQTNNLEMLQASYRDIHQYICKHLHSPIGKDCLYVTAAITQVYWWVDSYTLHIKRWFEGGKKVFRGSFLLSDIF